MPDDLKLVEKLENLLVVMQLTHQHFNTAELLPCIALARIGAAVKPRPISEAPKDYNNNPYIAFSLDGPNGGASNYFILKSSLPPPLS